MYIYIEREREREIFLYIEFAAGAMGLNKILITYKASAFMWEALNINTLGFCGIIGFYCNMKEEGFGRQVYCSGARFGGSRFIGFRASCFRL